MKTVRVRVFSEDNISDSVEVRVSLSTASDLVAGDKRHLNRIMEGSLVDDNEPTAHSGDTEFADSGEGVPPYDAHWPMAVFHRNEWHLADQLTVDGGEEIDFELRGERLFIDLDTCKWVSLGDVAFGKIARQT